MCTLYTAQSINFGTHPTPRAAMAREGGKRPIQNAATTTQKGKELQNRGGGVGADIRQKRTLSSFPAHPFNNRGVQPEVLKASAFPSFITLGGTSKPFIFRGPCLVYRDASLPLSLSPILTSREKPSCPEDIFPTGSRVFVSSF